MSTKALLISTSFPGGKELTFPSAFAAAGGGLNTVSPKERAISLLDLSISYPVIPESISVSTLALAALVGPGVIITAVVLFFVPGITSWRTSEKASLIRRKLWELHVGLAGLALSVAVAFFVTQGLKNIFGRPRPHFLPLCSPDLSSVEGHVVSGYGQVISTRWTLVSPSICTNTAALKDGFRSFPSGHCSFSWSGLLYLTLFLSAKFSIRFPYLGPGSSERVGATPTDRRSLHPQVISGPSSTARSNDTEMQPLHFQSRTHSTSDNKSEDATYGQHDVRNTPEQVEIYSRDAAPPTWGVAIAIIPLGVAAYISSTRYAEYWHHGFDCIVGALIGILSAYFAFRWYQMPLQQGQGWAWGPRTRDRAFGVRVGTGNYAGKEGSGIE